MLNATQWAAPCMKGGAGSARMSPRTARATTSGELAAGSAWYSAARKMSSWRHSTPLGMPVVPPGVEDVEVVRREALAARRGSASASACS